MSKNSNGQAILVLGTSGTGKTSSIQNLNPKETLILMSQFKPLPFGGWAKNYSVDKFEKDKGCILVCENFENHFFIAGFIFFQNFFTVNFTFSARFKIIIYLLHSYNSNT